MISEIILVMIFAITIIAFIKNKFYVKISYFIITLALILIASLRDADADYENYVMAFKYGSETMEPIIQLIISSIKKFSNNHIYFFIILAVIGIISKVLAFKILTKYYILSTLIYIAHFFILYDLIQIRAAAASGIMLLSIKPLYERKLTLFFFITIIATFFHYTALIFLIFLILDVRNIKYFIYLIPLVYLLNLSGLSISKFIELVPYSPIQNLYQKYYSLTIINSSSVNIFNTLQVSRCIVCTMMIYKIDEMVSDCEYSVILVKIYALACSFFVSFSDIAVIAFRLSDLLMVVEVILIPIFLFSILKKSIHVKIATVTISTAFLLGSIYYLKLFELFS